MFELTRLSELGADPVGRSPILLRHPMGAQRRFLQQKGCEAPASCVSSTLMEHPLRAKQRLAAVLLGEPLEQWVTARRPHTAWVTLASELYEALDGELSISHESLRLWYGPAEKAA